MKKKLEFSTSFCFVLTNHPMCLVFVADDEKIVILSLRTRRFICMVQTKNFPKNGHILIRKSLQLIYNQKALYLRII